MEKKELSKNQVWAWFKDDELVDIFIIKEIEDTTVRLYGSSHSEVDESFFWDLELIENVNDLGKYDEKKAVEDFCKFYGVPVPLRVVEVAKVTNLENMDDKELLEGCRNLADMLMVTKAQPYFNELFKRFDNYRRVRSLFYRFTKREF